MIYYTLVCLQFTGDTPAEMFYDKLRLPGLQEEVSKYDKICEEAYQGAKSLTVMRNSAWLDSPWPDFFSKRDPMKMPPTGITQDMLQNIGNVFSDGSPDSEFQVHGGQWSCGEDRDT